MDNILSDNEKNNINQLLQKINKESLEFEIRLGYFQEHFFKTDIDFEKYKMILNMDALYSNEKIKYEQVLVCKSENNTQKNILYENNKPVSVSYRKKNRVHTINLNLYGCRLSLSDEIDIKYSDETFSNCFRYKDRISKVSSDGKWSYDFTKVYDLDIKNENLKDIKQVLGNSKYHYEIEIEYLDNINNLKEGEIIEKLDMIKNKGLNDHKHILKKIQSLFSDKIEYNRKFKKLPAHMMRFKEITNHLITLNSKNINNIFKNFSVTEKADGENNFVFVSKDGVFLLNDRSKITKLPLELSDKTLVNSLLNGEYVNYLNAFYTFDILIYKGREVTNEYLPKRYTYMKEFEKGIKSNDKFKLQTKKYYMSDMIKSSNKIYNETKFPYQIDGLVFTPIDQPFRSVAYKWKPLNEVTTDFLVKKSHEPDTFYLYVTINKTDLQKYNIRVDDDHEKMFPMYSRNAFYVPIKFQMPNVKEKTYLVKDKTLKDNTVVEFSYDKKWVPMRLRVDKTENYHKSMRLRKFFGPNAFGVAYDNWESLHNDPITTDIITGKQPLPKSIKISRYYTGKTKSRRDSNIELMNLFHGVIIKDMLYTEYVSKPRKNHNLLELSGGRGGDLRRWIKNKIRYLTIQDIDQTALDEAKKRLSNMNHRMKVKYIQGDLRTEMHDKLGSFKFDAIVMNFAIHYMLGGKEPLQNLFNTINNNLKPGGYFVFTTLDGQLVFELLAKHSIQFQEYYNFKKDGKDIIKIKRLYKDNTFEQLGQEISVFVETIGEHAGEFLVNFDYLTGFFVKNGFDLVKSEYFKNILDSWENKPKMSQAEIDYSSLNRYMVLVKK